MRGRKRRHPVQGTPRAPKFSRTGLDPGGVNDDLYGTNPVRIPLVRPVTVRLTKMIILSKLADYGVIVATHLAAGADRQQTAAAIAEETRLPRATVAKILKAWPHAGLVTATRGAAGGYRLARRGVRDLGGRDRRRDRRRYRPDPMLGPRRRMRAHELLPDPAALDRYQPRGRTGAGGYLARCDEQPFRLCAGPACRHGPRRHKLTSADISHI